MSPSLAKERSSTACSPVPSKSIAWAKLVVEHTHTSGVPPLPAGPAFFCPELAWPFVDVCVSWKLLSWWPSTASVSQWLKKGPIRDLPWREKSKGRSVVLCLSTGPWANTAEGFGTQTLWQTSTAHCHKWNFTGKIVSAHMEKKCSNCPAIVLYHNNCP